MFLTTPDTIAHIYSNTGEWIYILFLSKLQLICKNSC